MFIYLVLVYDCFFKEKVVYATTIQNSAQMVKDAICESFENEDMLICTIKKLKVNTKENTLQADIIKAIAETREHL